jgi:nucleotide-binding universal stress UspA family protein
MLIQSDVRVERGVIVRAVEEARTRGESLVVLAVLDPAIHAEVAAGFTERGQIGPRPSDSFLDSLYERQEQLALQQVDEIISEAREADVRVEAAVRRGAYAKETLDAIRKLKPETVVIERRRGSLLRFASGDRYIRRLQQSEGFDLVEV